MVEQVYNQIREFYPERVFNNLDLYRLEFPVKVQDDYTHIISTEKFDVDPGLSAVWDILKVGENSSLIQWMTVNKTLAVPSLPFDFSLSPLRLMIKDSPGRIVSFYTDAAYVGNDLPNGMLQYLVNETNVKICMYTIKQCVISNCGKYAVTMSDFQNFASKIEISYQDLLQCI